MAPFYGRGKEVFFDITIDGKPAGRIKMELYADAVPDTVENFLALCNGERTGRTGMLLHYRGSTFHCTSQGIMCQGGDFTVGNGPGDKSIHGSILVDMECKRGCLSMPKDGPGSNGSQFLIWTAKPDALVGKHVVFGHIVGGMDVVKLVKKVGKKSGRTSKAVVVSGCGICG